MTSDLVGEVGFVLGEENLEEQLDFRVQDPMPLNFLLPDQPSILDWVFHMVKDMMSSSWRYFPLLKRDINNKENQVHRSSANLGG